MTTRAQLQRDAERDAAVAAYRAAVGLAYKLGGRQHIPTNVNTFKTSTPAIVRATEALLAALDREPTVAERVTP